MNEHNEQLPVRREFGAALAGIAALFRGSRCKVKGVPGTPYLTAWANSGKSRREQELRLMAIRVRFVASS
jgi:hypothetical protein